MCHIFGCVDIYQPNTVTMAQKTIILHEKTFRKLKPCFQKTQSIFGNCYQGRVNQKRKECEQVGHQHMINYPILGFRPQKPLTKSNRQFCDFRMEDTEYEKWTQFTSY